MAEALLPLLITALLVEKVLQPLVLHESLSLLVLGLLCLELRLELLLPPPRLSELRLELALYLLLNGSANLSVPLIGLFRVLELRYPRECGLKLLLGLVCLVLEAVCLPLVVLGRLLRLLIQVLQGCFG